MLGISLSSSLGRATALGFDYYIDSVSGSDSNTGRSLSQAWATTAHAHGQVGSTAGLRIGVAKGSEFFEQLPAFGTGSVIEAYGTGDRPRWRGDRVISNSGWTKTGGYTNIYQKTVTHGTATSPHASDPNNANTFHVGMWYGDGLTEILTPQFGSSTIATNLTALDAAAGSFTAHVLSSTDGDPRSGSGGTSYVYYVNLPGATKDPASAGLTLSYAEQVQVATLAVNGTWRGLEIMRTANKDMTGMATDGTTIGAEISDCMFREGAIHGMLARPRLALNNTAVPRADRNISGYGFHFYFDNAGGASPAFTARGNLVQANGSVKFNIGIGSHGSTAGDIHERIECYDNTVEDVISSTGGAFAFGQATNGILIDGAKVLRGAVAVRVIQNATTIRNMRYLSATGATGCTALEMSANCTVENSAFVWQNSTSTNFRDFFHNNVADDALDRLTLTLDNVSVVGGTAPAQNRYMQVDIVATDCVLGSLSPTDQTAVSSITATNSFLSEKTRTLAEMTSAGATLTSCIGAWQLEQLVKVIGASDIQEGGSQNTTATGGTTQVTFTTPNYPVGTCFRVKAWDGSANFHTIAQSTGSNPVAIADTTPGSWTSKSTVPTAYNSIITFSGPIRSRSSGNADAGPNWTMVHGAVTLSAKHAGVSSAYFTAGSGTYVPNNLAVPFFGAGSPINLAAGTINQVIYVTQGGTLTVSAVIDKTTLPVWGNSDDPANDDFGVLTDASSLYAHGMGRQAS